MVIVPVGGLSEVVQAMKLMEDLELSGIGASFLVGLADACLCVVADIVEFL